MSLAIKLGLDVVENAFEKLDYNVMKPEQNSDSGTNSICCK